VGRGERYVCLYIAILPGPRRACNSQGLVGPLANGTELPSLRCDSADPRKD
jgi:hypothetical protein